jgi:hypothetical protein
MILGGAFMGGAVHDTYGLLTGRLPKYEMSDMERAVHVPYYMVSGGIMGVMLLAGAPITVPYFAWKKFGPASATDDKRRP